MKILWITLAVLFSLCLLCGGAGYFLFSKGKAVFDAAGKYGDQAFAAVSAKWDAGDFLNRADPEALSQGGQDAVRKNLQTLADRLGPIEGPFDSHVLSVNAKNVNGSAVTYARWTTDAMFAKGAASVQMELADRGGTWRIRSLRVESSRLSSPVQIGPQDAAVQFGGTPQ